MAFDFQRKTLFESLLERKIIKSYQARWSVLDGMGRMASKSEFSTNGSSSLRDVLTSCTVFGCFRVFFNFHVLAPKGMDCMDDLLWNMDMIRYEYLIL